MAGSPANSVRRRIKIAAILYDQVLVEDGEWTASAGPSGNVDLRSLSTSPKNARWQTAHERHSARGQVFRFAMQPSDSNPSHPFQTIVQSETAVYWRATFEPIKSEVPRAYPWLLFGHVPESAEAKRVANTWVRADQRDRRLDALIPEQFVRQLVLRGANHDLVLAAQLGAAVSMEALHARVLSARIERGEAQRAFGAAALEVIHPNVGELGWDDIDEIRSHRDIRYLRDLLRDIEEAAWSASTSSSSFELSVRDEFEEELRKANTQVVGTWKGSLAVTLVGFIVGEVVSFATGSPPLLGGVAGGAAGFVADRAAGTRRHPRWLAAEQVINRRASSINELAT